MNGDSMPKATSTAQESRLLTIADIAARLGVSVRKAWRIAAAEPDFPKSIRIGSRGTRFDSNEFDAYLALLRNKRSSLRAR